MLSWVEDLLVGGLGESVVCTSDGSTGDEFELCIPGCLAT